MYDRFFAPRGVAVIGASRNPTKLGYGVARNLVVSGYPGELYFVNPRGGELFDREMFPSLVEVPDPVDLAVIIIPAKSVPTALEACGQRGIGFAIVGAGGFRETGPAGLELEQRCLEIARKHHVRVLGPNCIGFLDTHMPIDTSFLPLPGPIPGDIAFLSHSGAICEAVIDWARGQGFGLSRLISLGNQMDLSEADLLAPTASDPETNVIALYIEGVRDGSRFIEEARKITADIPVIAIKVGQSEAGRAAVASHTGALAGQEIAYDAAFEKAGVIRARHSEEMFDWARALAWCPLPEGPRMALLTNAGGPGAIAADALEANELQLAALSAATVEGLQGLLPDAASLRNPVDMLAGAGPREYADCLQLLLEDDGVDGVMVILPPPPVTTAAEVAGAIIPMIRSSEKPVVVALMGEELIAHAAKLFRQSRIPDYRFPERAASALKVLWLRSQTQGGMAIDTPERIPVDQEVVESMLSDAQIGSSGFVPSRVASEVVSAYGIPVQPYRFCSGVTDLTEAAQELTFPLAMKVESAELPHKSEIGGVMLDILDEQGLTAAWKALSAELEEHGSLDLSEGILLQKMAPDGIDVIVGIVRDAQFGPLVMFGSGGVEVEALKDVAFALAPLSRSEAESLLDRTYVGSRLAGIRGAPPADRAAVIDAIIRLAQLAEDYPKIQELEVNPLRVYPQGEGARAIDLRLRLD